MIDPSLKKKLIHEDRWSRTYQAGENFYASESKFEADGLSVSVEELSSAWDSWNESEKLSFVNAYRSKTQFVESDEKILEFLMAQGDEPVWSTIASSLALHHSNKKMVLDFLLERLKSGSEPKSNFIQALYVLGDVAALPSLHQLHDRLSERVKSGSHGQADHWAVNDFLTCCKALAYLEGAERYRDEIRPFLDDPNELIRIHAQNALAGPQPEEFRNLAE
jgi:hypothetical protein